MDNFQNIYLTGFGTGLNDFDPGPNVYNLLCGTGLGDIFILKVDSTGDFKWAITLGDVNHDWPKAITIDNAENIYSTGHFRGTVDFNPGHQIFNLTTTGNLFNSYFLKLNKCFFINGISSTPTNFNSPNCNGSVSINPIGGTPPYNIIWSSIDTTNLCEGWYTATITDANGCIETDSVYVNFLTGIEELNAAGITVYPNPVKNKLTINSQKEIGEIKIYDVLGKLIHQELIKNYNAEINVKEINAGIYFIEIDGAVAKFVKE